MHSHEHPEHLAFPLTRKVPHPRKRHGLAENAMLGAAPAIPISLKWRDLRSMVHMRTTNRIACGSLPAPRRPGSTGRFYPSRFYLQQNMLLRIESIWCLYSDMSSELLIIAAGMGSRYGGLKQLEIVGPSGETLLDCSVFDAIRAGFERVVFIIRRDFEQEFRERIGHPSNLEVGEVAR
jgi:hypothetical protein